MKKSLLLILCIFSFIDITAQNYSELDLIGKWEIASYPDFPLISLEVNNQYEAIISSSEKAKKYNFGKIKKPGYTCVITDIFITSGFILHIHFDNVYGSTGKEIYRLIIKSLTSSELTLSTIDGEYTATFKKTEESNIRPTYVGATESNYYNLQGNKLSGPSDKAVYIHNGKKYVNTDGNIHSNKQRE